MFLMPQLSTPFAQSVVDDLRSRSITECREKRSLSHPNRVFTPTGGTRIRDTDLQAFCDKLADAAEHCGYPSDSAQARSRFDSEIAILLADGFQISENEAAQPGVWNFLSCMALPDLVRWRFPADDGTSAERFLAGQKNTFGRLWWRAKAYHDSSHQDPYWLVREIGEDESVAIMERTTLSGIRPFVVAALRALHACHRVATAPRSDIMRDAMKRFRRMAPLIAIESLAESDLRRFCHAIVMESIGALKKGSGTRQPAGQVGAVMLDPDVEPALSALVNERGFEIRDYRSKKGALWVITDRADDGVNRQLAKFGFQYHAERGWWKK